MLGEHELPCGEFGRRCATGASLPRTARLARVRLAVVCYAARASPLWPNGTRSVSARTTTALPNPVCQQSWCLPVVASIRARPLR